LLANVKFIMTLLSGGIPDLLLSRWTPCYNDEKRKWRNVERIGEGMRRSLRADEMEGSISQPEISGVKDKTVWVAAERTLSAHRCLCRQRESTYSYEIGLLEQ
jgi:hypothetical protein